MSVRRSVLPSGLRIVTEEVPSVRSAAIGIWSMLDHVMKPRLLLGLLTF
jgi:hypothetical protein